MPSKRIRSTIRQSLIRLDTMLQSELNETMWQAGLTLKKDFQNVTSNWRNRPTFTINTVIGVDEIAVRITPSRNKAGMIWNWLDQGTGRWGKRKSAYPIKPKPPNTTLAFQTGYSPKTAVGSKGLQGYGGIGRATGGWVRVKEVMHPGIKPRKFGIAFTAKMKPSLKVRIDNAIRRAIRRAAN